MPKRHSCNTKTLRKCPDCQSTSYERTTVLMFTLKTEQGKRVSRSSKVIGDMGHWKCLVCGLELRHDGVTNRTEQRHMMMQRSQKQQQQQGGNPL